MSQFKAGEKAIVMPINEHFPFVILEITEVTGSHRPYPIICKVEDHKDYPFAEHELQPPPIPHGDTYWNIDGE